jgi:diaminohydroxyphosphoribosylaminopyrimidine deaminase/5-amino-6-(5-phosphoribosylamino)uracil reductase
VVVGCGDPDPRTAGAGIARIRAAGIAVELIESPACLAGQAGYLTVQRQCRPHVTLKLALSEDGRLARAPGEPRWLTGAIARAHVHAWRARMDAILVGRGTYETDNPQLDVRLLGLEERSPERWLLSSGAAPAGWRVLPSPAQLGVLLPAQYLMVEGGAATARAFLAAGLVDRMMLYRAPLALGGDLPALPELTAAALAGSPDWTRSDHRLLGNDTLDVYDRKPCSLE